MDFAKPPLHIRELFRRELLTRGGSLVGLSVQGAHEELKKLDVYLRTFEELIEQQESACKVAEGYATKVKELEEDIRARTQWALDTESRLNAEVQKQVDELGQAVEALHRTERELEERTAWAQKAQGELDELVRQIYASTWIKIGRTLRLCDVLKSPPPPGSKQ